MLEDMQPKDYRRPCKLGLIISKLEPKDQAILEDALKDLAKWPNRQLTMALNDRGLDFTVETLRTHRQNRCGCARLGK